MQRYQLQVQVLYASAIAGRIKSRIHDITQTTALSEK